jgi:putative addiction module killer protein
MAADEYSLRYYVTVNGKRPFKEWFRRLWDSDHAAAKRVQVRLDRLCLGNFGDSRRLEGGLAELRIDIGPGYRVYFIQDDLVLIVLLCGGDKSTQKRDIARAREYAADYRRRKHAPNRIVRRFTQGNP